MTDIAPSVALEMVERGLRQDVLPLVDDGHAVAALRAALTIVGNVRAGLEVGDAPCREVVATGLPVADGWADAVSAASAATAEQVRPMIDRARASADPVAAREDLLRAAQLCLAALWEAGDPDPDLLAALRRVTRLDAEAHARTVR